MTEKEEKARKSLEEILAFMKKLSEFEQRSEKVNILVG